MGTKSFSSIIAFLIIPALTLSSLCPAADQLDRKTYFNPDRAPKYLFSEPQLTNSDIQINNESNLIGLKQSNVTSSPGSIVGLTSYDLQHNGAMGRQISFSFIDNIVHMVWTYQSLANIPGDRRIAYQYFDPPDYGPGSYIATEAQYTGFVTNDVLPDGTPIFICNVLEADEYHSGYFYKNTDPPLPFLDEIIDYGMETIWPVTEVHCSDSPRVTNDVIYALTHDLTASDDMFLYRKVGGGGWSAGDYMETCANLSHIIVADPNSDSVAIVYTDDRGGLAGVEGGQSDLDVYYKLSTDQGFTWSDAINISNYTTDSLWRAYNDLSALFTSDGVLHIIWSARKLRNASSYENYKCRLVHWSSDYQRTSVIDAADFDMVWNESPCDCGAGNLYIAKMSLTQCDSKLYALFTKFGDALEPGALFDCSQMNYANGELYLASSDDWGQSWDPAWNLTQTRTPGCDSAECESDNWATMVRYGMIYGDETIPDTLDILYINDKDAGAIPQGEGTWCANNVMHYRFPCRDVDHVGRISLEPNSYLEDTSPGEELQVTLKIENIGNGPLTIQDIHVDYVNGADWISIGSYSSPIGVGNSELVAVTLNAGGILTEPSSVWDANLIVDTDAPSDVDTVPVRLYTSSGPQQYCDSISATTKKLMVCNTGRLGNGYDGASLDIPGDCDADIEVSPNGDLYLYDASPMISWNYGIINYAYTAVFTQLPTEPGTFRWLSGFGRTSETNYNRIVCTLVTTDELFAVGATLWAPTDGHDFVIARYEFFPYSKIRELDEVFIGMVFDWDVPSDAEIDNSSGYYEPLNTIWQRGVQTSTVDEDPPHSCPIPEDQRYAGVAIISGSMRNAWTADNMVLRSGSGFNPDSLYNRMSTLSGYNLHSGTGEDSVVDLHTGITVNKVDMDPGKSYSFYVVMATTNTGEEDLYNQIDAAYTWALNNSIYPDECLCLPGDANNDSLVNVGDAVYIINYVFRGGPAPQPYEMCSGDPNADCGGGVGDAVYLISYVFKGGDGPVSCWEWVNNCGTPLWK